MNYRLLALSFSAALFATSASAFDLSVVGAMNFATPSLQVSGVTASGVDSKMALGGGVLMGFDLNPAFQLEIGALYIGRDFTYPVSGGGTAEDSFHAYEIPIILRFDLLKYVTIGGGLYYAIPTGTSTYTLNSSSTDQAASTDFKSDLGAVASVSVKIPLNFAINLLVDGRYYYGLTDGSQISGDELKTRDTQVLVGLDFGF